MKIKISKIGLILVVIGTFVYLFSYLIDFVLNNSPTNYSCLIQESVNGTQKMMCYKPDHFDIKEGILFTGVITAIIIIFGNIVVEYGHKNQESLTMDTNNWVKVLRAKGYQ